MSSEEAKDYGLVDAVLSTRSSTPLPEDDAAK